jgi:formylglycine-generating enzyme required for sulfatase activity
MNTPALRGLSFKCVLISSLLALSCAAAETTAPAVEPGTTATPPSVVSTPATASSAVAATPAAGALADDPVLTRQIVALRLVWEDVQANAPGTEQRRTFLDEYLAKSALLLRALPDRHPQAGAFWALRVTAALELNRQTEASDAGTKMLELGFDSTNDEQVQRALALLERRGLLKLPQKAVVEKAAPVDSAQVAADQAEADRWVASMQGENAKLSAAIGIEMVAIPAGSFLMSSPPSEVGRLRDEGPQTKVTFSRPFWMSKYEVTQAEWRSVMPVNRSIFRGDRLPVENITWDEAMTFCQKLTAREWAAGRLPEGFVFTLPTEAQWEYACRAGRTGPYAGDLDAMAWYVANSTSKTHEVGKKQPNVWGLHDMHGNVWEWCSDWYASGFPGGAVADPTGPSTGTARVARGGGWYDVAVCSRSACRGYSSPDFRYGNLGLRLALVYAPVKN